MRGLRYPRLILQRLGFPLALTQTPQALASSCLPQQIFIYFSSKNSLQLPKDTRNSRKIYDGNFWRNKVTK